jgi:hypothetical protein
VHFRLELGCFTDILLCRQLMSQNQDVVFCTITRTEYVARIGQCSKLFQDARVKMNQHISGTSNHGRQTEDSRTPFFKALMVSMDESNSLNLVYNTMIAYI